MTIVPSSKIVNAAIGLLLFPLTFAIHNQNVMEIYLTLMYLYTIVAWAKVSKSYTNFYFIFLIYCFLCNCGQTFLHAVGLSWDGIVDIYSTYGQEQIFSMLRFQALCVGAMHFGAVLSLTGDLSNKDKYIPISNIHNRGFVETAYFVLAAYMILQYIQMFIGRVDMNYGEFYYSGDSTTSVNALASVLFHTSFYVCLYKHGRENNPLLTKILVTAGFLSFLMLAVGSRSLVFSILFGFVVILPMVREINLSTGKKIKYGVYLILGLVLMQGLHALRQYSLSAVSFGTLDEAFGTGLGLAMINAVQEMGGTARCILQTMQSVSESVGGEPTMIYACLKALVPYELIQMFGVQNSSEALSYWVTEDGGGALGTAAWGYSILAEAYYDYQWMGAIAMAVFSFVWIKLEIFSRSLLNKGNLIASMAVFYFLSYLVFSARAELILFSSTARFCFYLIIITLLARLGNKSHETI